MQNTTKNFFRLKKISKYDFKPYVEEGYRKHIS